MDLQTLQQECLACQRCGLCQTRTNVVFGQGVPNAEVLFVGEGPGASEDEQGLPFVGRSGQLLDHYLEAIEHGKFFDKQGTLFMGTYHPAALLRYPVNKPAVFGDFVALREKITQVCDHTY